MMLTDIDTHKVKLLIAKMDATHRLSDLQYKMKDAARRVDFLQDYTAEELETHFSKFRASADTIRLRAPQKADSDLAWQLSMMSAMIDDYTFLGESLAPHHPWRITVLLRKAKNFELEREFLASYFRLFWSPRGSSMDTKLGERAIKIGISIPHPPDSTIAPPAMPITESVTAQGLTISSERPYLPNITITVKEIVDESEGNYFFNFAFRCHLCEGSVIVIPDDGDEKADVACKSCQFKFGPYGYLLKIANQTAKVEIAKLTQKEKRP